MEGAQRARSRARRKVDTPFSDLWDRVDRAVSEVIDRTTFADLLNAWSERQTRYVRNWEI
jgi:DNA-binding IscR family transcriptional regulator